MTSTILTQRPSSEIQDMAPHTPIPIDHQLIDKFRDSCGDEPLSPPSGLTTAPSGDLIVADDFNHRIQIYDSEGNLKTTFGKKGTLEGEFMYPKGVALDPAGNIYVADSWNHRVQKFDSEGNFQSSWGKYGRDKGQLNEPYDIWVEPSGNLLVVERSNHRIQIFRSDGVSLGWVGSRATILEEKLAYIYETSLEMFSPPVFEFPTSIARDEAGNYYVADSGNHRVVKFNREWKQQHVFGEKGKEAGRFLYPMAVAVGSNKLVYIADLNNNRLQVWTPEGLYLGAIDEADDNQPLKMPSVLCADPSGDIRVALTFNTLIFKFRTGSENLKQIYDDLCEAEPTNPSIHFSRGRFHQAQDNPSLAMKDFCKAIHAFQADPEKSMPLFEILPDLALHLGELLDSDGEIVLPEISLDGILDAFEEYRQSLTQEIMDYLGSLKESLPERIQEEMNQEKLILEGREDPVHYNESLQKLKKQEQSLFHSSRSMFYRFRKTAQSLFQLRERLLTSKVSSHALNSLLNSLKSSYFQTGTLLKDLLDEKEKNETELVQSLQGAEDDRSKLDNFHIKSALNQKILEIINALQQEFLNSSSGLRSLARKFPAHSSLFEDMNEIFSGQAALLFPRILLGRQENWEHHYDLDCEFQNLVDTFIETFPSTSFSGSSEPDQAPDFLSPIPFNTEELDPRSFLHAHWMSGSPLRQTDATLEWGPVRLQKSRASNPDSFSDLLASIDLAQNSYEQNFESIFPQLLEIALQRPELEKKSRALDVRDRKTPLLTRDNQMILDFQTQLLMRMLHTLEVNEMSNLVRLISGCALLISVDPQGESSREWTRRLRTLRQETEKRVAHFLNRWQESGLEKMQFEKLFLEETQTTDLEKIDQSQNTRTKLEQSNYEYIQARAFACRLARIRNALDRFADFADSLENHSPKDPTFQLKKSFGSAGLGEGHLSMPFGVTHSLQGDIFVSDHFRSEILRFSPDGILLGTFSGFGNGPGHLKGPYSMCTDHEGHILVADLKNRRVAKFTPEGEWVVTVGQDGPVEQQLGEIYSCSTDPDNKIWVADFHHHRIQVYHPEGQWLRSLGGPGTEVSNLNHPWTVCCLENGEYLVGDQSRHMLKRFNDQGELLGSLDRESHLFQQFVFSTYDSTHGIFVADPMTCQIIQMDLNLNPIQTFRNPGKRSNQMWRTGALSIFNNQLVATDFDNHRLQIFELSP